MSWSIVKQTIVAGGQTGPVSAGSALYDGWVDVSGNVWEVSANNFFAPNGPISATPWFSALLRRPLAEATADTKITVRYKYESSARANLVYLFGRHSGASGAFKGYIAAWNVNTVRMYQYTASGSPVSITSSASGAFSPVAGTLYDFSFDVVQTNSTTTTLTFTVSDTSGNVLLTQTATDTTAALQNVMGVAALTSTNTATGYVDTVSQATTYTDAAPAGATAFSMTGPTSGVAGTASSNFTVTPNGTMSSAVVVTPNDGGAGGSFNPSTLTFASGSSAAQTFTYTPSAAGTDTIAITNNGSLTNPSNITYTASAAPVAATAYTLTGPSTATVGQASSNYTVTSNGTLSSAVTVTPNDSSGGGTFTPASVTLGVGTNTSATFTYTPASAGAKSIAATNNGSLTNPGAVTTTASASSNITIAVNSPAFRFSPGNWKGDTGRGGSAWRQSWNNGAYFEFAWNASSSPTATILIPTNSSNGNRISYFLNGVMTDNVACTGSIALSGITPSARNVLRVCMRASTQSGRWNNGNSALQIQGMQLDSGSSADVAATYSQWGIIIGDSITEGVKANSSADDNLACYSYLLGNFLKTLGYDYSINACASNGWLQPGDTTGDIPAWYFVNASGYQAASSRWNLIDQGQSILDSNGHISAYGATGQEPAFIYMNLMTNELIHALSTTYSQQAVTGWLTAARAAAPNAWIFMQIPFGIASITAYANAAAYVAALKAGIAAYQTANPNDNRIMTIDFGTDFSVLMATYTTGVQAYMNSDAIHPTVNGNALIAPKVSAVVATALATKSRYFGSGGKFLNS